MIVVQRLTDENEFEEIGRVRDGEIVAGEERLTDIFDRATWAEATEPELAARLDGPRVVAGIVPDSGAVEVGNRYRTPGDRVLTVVEIDDGVVTVENEIGTGGTEPLDDFRGRVLDGEYERVDGEG